MFSFNYFTPTKVVFGKKSEEKVADLIKEFGGKNMGSAKLLNEADMLEIFKQANKL